METNIKLDHDTIERLYLEQMINISKRPRKASVFFISLGNDITQKEDDEYELYGTGMDGVKG